MTATRTALPPEPRLEPVLDFLRLLWSIEHQLQSKSMQMRATLGITGPQRLVLRVVSKSPGLSAGELAHVLRLHPSTLTGIIQRLVDKRLLTRDRDPEDTRRMRLRVTSRAARFTRLSKGTIEAAVKRALEGLPRAQVSEARAVLSAVSTELGRASIG